ncbi:MAG: hypothetical protein K0R68_1815 [Mycobacterium sp.]|nr:hypothetical protein [Mycobacterium sp.]
MPAAVSPSRRIPVRWLACLVFLLLIAASPVAAATPPAQISSGSQDVLTSLLADPDRDAEGVSARFLGTPYGADTLIGSAEVPEQLVVELQRVDCFTYADYVEAAKRADGDRAEFVERLVDVRYKDGVVDFAHRKHFFTDWSAAAPPVATDITAGLGAQVVPVVKELNRKDSGGVYLPGLPVVARTVSYLPSNSVDNQVVSRLRTGDYLGAYAEDGGLDVTHVGIFISTPTGPVFRNASSRSADNSVVDTPLFDYLVTVPGVVVLRPVL